jgi:hypothetical protein
VEGFTYDYYEDLTQEDMAKIVDAFKRGEKPKASTTTCSVSGYPYILNSAFFLQFSIIDCLIT